LSSAGKQTRSALRARPADRRIGGACIATRSITPPASGCAICRSPRRSCCGVPSVRQRWGILASKPSPQSRGKVDKVSLLLPSIVLNAGFDEAIEQRRDDYAGPLVRQKRRWRGSLTPGGRWSRRFPRSQGDRWRNRHSATHEPNAAYVGLLRVISGCARPSAARQVNLKKRTRRTRSSRPKAP
jgi:hypothetical protein